MKKPKPAAPTGLLTLQETQDKLKCSRRKVYMLGEQGRLDLCKFDGSTRVTQASIERLMSEIVNTPWAPGATKKQAG
jgi:hypothetical protein